MGQEIGKVRASAQRATPAKFCGRTLEKTPRHLYPLIITVIATVFLALLASGAFAAESAKPSAVVTVRSPKLVVTPKPDDKPALCPPSKSDSGADPKATGTPPADSNAAQQKKDASGSAASDLSVQMSSHEDPEKDVSSTESADSADKASRQSSSLQIRLKDKDIDAAPTTSPAQCTVPGASTATDEAPAPH